VNKEQCDLVALEHLWGHVRARYQVGGECTGSQHFHFWLEWDRGTMNVRDLAVKFSSYAHARCLA
jgi:hypothetical protein